MTANSTEAAVTDEQLAERIALRNEPDGDVRLAEADFEQLYHRHSRRLWVFLVSRVRPDDVDDIHQVIWQRVWENLPNQFHGGNFRAWLPRIARNYLIDLSRRKRLEVICDGRLTDPGRGADDHLVRSERMEILRSCIGRLDEQMARLVRARLRGDSYEEACVSMRIEPAQAHKLFHMAKEKLQKCVQRALR